MKVGAAEALPSVRSVDTRTLAERVAEVIRDGIVRGTFPAGQPLRELELAAHIGVSRIPLREALCRLAGQGFITTHPHRGAVVANISAEELRDIADARLALDELAIRLAIPHLTANDIDKAEVLLQMKLAAADVAEFSRLDRELIATIYRAANRPILLATIERLIDESSRYLHLFFLHMKHRRASDPSLRKFIEALRRRCPDDAVMAIRECCGAAIESATRFIEEHRATGGAVSLDRMKALHDDHEIVTAAPQRPSKAYASADGVVRRRRNSRNT